MPAGLLDRVDCARAAKGALTFERVYALGELPRLQDLLAATEGSVLASFEFIKMEGGRAGARVAVRSQPRLICQRCLQAWTFAVDGSSEIDFAASESDAAAAADSQREPYIMQAGMVSLRELAEEELLLALPVVAVCDTPLTCGQMPAAVSPMDEAGAGLAAMSVGETTRPFAGLQDLLKKPDRT